MKKTTKKNAGIPCYVVACAETGTEDDGDVTSIGVFASKTAAKRAINQHINEYFPEWEEASCGEAWREDDPEEGKVEVNSGDDRYVRTYQITASTLFN